MSVLSEATESRVMAPEVENSSVSKLRNMVLKPTFLARTCPLFEEPKDIPRVQLENIGDEVSRVWRAAPDGPNRVVEVATRNEGKVVCPRLFIHVQ